MENEIVDERIPDIDAIAEAAHEMEQGAMNPAENWSKIVELAKAIELGAQDLQDQLRDFNKSSLV